MAVESAYETPEELRIVVDELVQLVTIEATKQGNLFSEEKNPRGYHWIKVWNSEKVKGKYSFSIAFGSGVMSAISGFEEDAPYL